MRQAQRNWAVTRAGELVGKDGSKRPFSLSARDLFSDLDSTELKLVGLEGNPPWLQLMDGKLRMTAGANPAPGTYSFAIAGSDGFSRTPLTSFSLAIDPQVSIGSLNIPSGSALQFQFIGAGNDAVELLMQTLDDNDQPLHSPRLVAGQMGRDSGLPNGLSGDLSNAVAGDLFTSGRMAFFLRRPMQSAELIPLEISNSGSGAFRLVGGNLSVDAAMVNAPAPTPLTSFVEVGGETLLGVALPNLTPTGDQQRDSAMQRLTVTIDLFREASFNSRIGFYLADQLTGAVVDGRTGTFVTGTPFDEQGNQSPDYINKATEHAIWSGSVGNGDQATITQNFDVHGSLNLDDKVLLPFIQVDTGNSLQTFIAGSSGNSDRISHITLLGNNQFGFEDQLKGGDFDLDDMVARVRSVAII